MIRRSSAALTLSVHSWTNRLRIIWLRESCIESYLLHCGKLTTNRCPLHAWHRLNLELRNTKDSNTAYDLLLLFVTCLHYSWKEIIFLIILKDFFVFFSLQFQRNWRLIETVGFHFTWLMTSGRGMHSHLMASWQGVYRGQSFSAVAKMSENFLSSKNAKFGLKTRILETSMAKIEMWAPITYSVEKLQLPAFFLNHDAAASCIIIIIVVVIICHYVSSFIRKVVFIDVVRLIGQVRCSSRASWRDIDTRRQHQ